MISEETHFYSKNQPRNKILWLILYILLSSVLINICRKSNEIMLIHTIDSIPSKLIPYRVNTPGEFQIYSQIYETLLKLSPDNKTLISGLAQKWDYSKDNTCLTVTLKRDTPFHDGTLLDAETAISSIEWLKGNTTSPFLSLITKTETVDEYSFKIHLSESNSQFLYYLASRKGIVMISQNALNSNSVLENPVGTGPFFVEKKDSTCIELSAFLGYKERSGNLNKIAFKYFPYSEKLKSAFIKGEVDIVYTIDGYSIDRLHWSGNIKYLVQKPLYTDLLGFNLKNITAQKKLFRKAVKYALNIDKIHFNMNRGSTIPAKSPLPEIYPEFQDIKQKQSDINSARSIINGLDMDSTKIYLLYPSQVFVRSAYIEALKTELRKADIHVELLAYDSWDSYIEAIINDSSALFLYGWKSDIIGDAGNLLYSLFHSESEYNFFQYKNDSVDHLLLKSQTEFNNEQRQILYRKVLNIILEDTPVIFLNHLKEYYAYNSKKIKSITMNPYGIINYKDVIIDENY